MDIRPAAAAAAASKKATVVDVVMDAAKQKAKELELANYKNDMKYFKVLIKPRSVRQIALEAEDFNKMIHRGEESGLNKDELIALRMDFATRRDAYKYTCGLVYELPAMVSKGEKSALIKLFNDLDGYSWSNNFGWIGQPKSITRNKIDPLEASAMYYDGLTVEVPEESANTLLPVGHVTEINLTGNGCVGKVTEELGRLDNCRSLLLGWNLLRSRVPKSISNLKKLAELDLSCNRLSGGLDKDMFTLMVNLRILDLSANDLTGSIPSSIGQLVCLQTLNLSMNQFTDTIPNSISNLIELRDLKLYNNQIIGEIPNGVSKLVKLQCVNLSKNQIQFGLNHFNHNYNLKQLLVNNNIIEGSMDKSISNLRKLEILYIQNNRIAGYIPDELCLLSKLRRFNASNNDLHGVIPDDIGNLLNLESLILTNNALKGPMPLSIARIKKLQDFHVFKSFPSEMCYQSTAFNRQEFERVHVFGPSLGIDSIHWDSKTLYGLDKEKNGQEESISIFSDKMK